FIHFFDGLFGALADQVDLTIGYIPPRSRFQGNVLRQSARLARSENFDNIVRRNLHPEKTSFHFYCAVLQNAPHRRRLAHIAQSYFHTLRERRLRYSGSLGQRRLHDSFSLFTKFPFRFRNLPGSLLSRFPLVSRLEDLLDGFHGARLEIGNQFLALALPLLSALFLAALCVFFEVCTAALQLDASLLQLRIAALVVLHLGV